LPDSSRQLSRLIHSYFAWRCISLCTCKAKHGDEGPVELAEVIRGLITKEKDAEHRVWGNIWFESE
jgi:hypothetical protein